MKKLARILAAAPMLAVLAAGLRFVHLVLSAIDWIDGCADETSEHYLWDEQRHVAECQ